MRALFALSILPLLIIVQTSCNQRISMEMSLSGRWIREIDGINYGSMYFVDSSTVEFSSRGDTLYRYRFRKLPSRIIMTGIEGEVFTVVLSVVDKTHICLYGLPLDTVEVCYRRVE
jgi:hypothetical protein